MFPKPSTNGPSCTRRTSATLPTRAPSASATRRPITSLICIVAAPGDVVDDVVADPVLGGAGAQRRPIGGDGHGPAGFRGPGDRDAGGNGGGAGRRPRHRAAQPAGEGSAGQPVPKGSPPRGDGPHVSQVLV